MLEWLYEARFFGNSIYQVVLFFVAVVLSVILGKIVYYFIKTRARESAKKSRSRIDNLVIGTIDKPLVFFLIIAGIGIGLRMLTIPAGLLGSIDAISSILMTVGAAWITVNLVDAVIKLYLVPLV